MLQLMWNKNSIEKNEKEKKKKKRYLPHDIYTQYLLGSKNSWKKLEEMIK